MIKRNKYILLILILLLCLYIPQHVLASDVSTAGTISMGSTSGGNGGEQALPKTTVKSDVKRYDCEYDNDLKKTRTNSVNAYNSKDKSIIPNSTTSLVKFQSGTWIGINIQEFKRATWNVKATNTWTVKKAWTCTFKGKKNNKDCKTTRMGNSSLADCITYCPNNYSWKHYKLGNFDNGLCICETPLPEGKSVGPITRSIEWYATSPIDCDGIIADDDPCTESKAEPVPIKIKGWSEWELPEQSTEHKNCTNRAVYETIEGTDGAREYIDTPSLEPSIKDPNDNNKNKIYSFDTNDNVEELSYEIPELIDLIDKKGSDDPVNWKYDIYSNYKNCDSLTHRGKCDYFQTYEYHPDKVCINVNTSNVGYNIKNNNIQNKEIQNCTATTSEEKAYIKEIKSKTITDQYFMPFGKTALAEVKKQKQPTPGNEKVTYWPYFIPLNTPTSDNIFYLEIGSKGAKLWSEAQCKKAIENYPIDDRNELGEYTLNYTDALKRADKAEWNRDYTITKVEHGGAGSSLDMAAVEKGCLFSTKVKFKIVQNFYGEDEKESKEKYTKGYKLYYRPIDVTKPFPNMNNDNYVWNNSLWKDVYDAEKNTITVKDKNNKTTVTKLSESFDEITYQTTNISTSAIREYNKDNPYTKWTDINLDGTSTFIDKHSSLITRKIDKKKFYKLGCGPDNSDEEWCK